MNLPVLQYYHKNENQAFSDRIKIIYELIDKFKKDSKIIILARQIVGGINPARELLDLVCAKKVWDYVYQHVPFRRDVNGVETIQYPDITLRYGGDCDDYCVLNGSLLESLGIPVMLAVSQQNNNFFDHIFVVLPSLGEMIFDTTHSGGFNAPKTQYRNLKTV